MILVNPFLQFAKFFFCFGIIICLNKEKRIPILANKGFYFLIAYIILCATCYYFGYEPGAYEPNVIELLLHSFLVLLFSFAYTKPELTSKSIGKTDISYGLYIYHSLLIHSFYELGFRDKWIYVIPLIIICLLVGWLSWEFVEKRALKLKKKSLYKI